MLISAIILAGTAAAGEGESGAKEQHAAAAAAGEDADNLNTNAGDKPSSASGKLQHADDAATDKSTVIGGFNQRQGEALPPQIFLSLKLVVWAKLQNDDVLLQ